MSEIVYSSEPLKAMYPTSVQPAFVGYGDDATSDGSHDDATWRSKTETVYLTRSTGHNRGDTSRYRRRDAIA